MSRKKQEKQEQLAVKDFFDRILPGTLKFYSDHYICGDSYRCVWAIKEYPPSTEEQAILSQLDEATWASLFSQKLKPYTNSTLTDPEKLRQDLLAARERKYAVDNMEHEYGIRCVGVPVMNGSGRTVAGISISCPSLRMDDEKVKEYAACLQQITENISIYF